MLIVASYQLPACILKMQVKIIVRKAKDFHVLNLNSGYIVL